MAKKTDKPEEAYDERLKPYAAVAEDALDRFFTTGEREDAAFFFRLLDEMKASTVADALTPELKGLCAAANLTKGAKRA